MNPLRDWFNRTGTTHHAFLRRVPISQSYLTMLLSDAPPWPSRTVMRILVKETDGAVTADKWLALSDPPPQRVGPRS